MKRRVSTKYFAPFVLQSHLHDLWWSGTAGSQPGRMAGSGVMPQALDRMHGWQWSGAAGS